MSLDKCSERDVTTMKTRVRFLNIKPMRISNKVCFGKILSESSLLRVIF